MSAAPLSTIPGLPGDDSAELLRVLAANPRVEQVWLYGSRAMQRHRAGSDIDLSLEGANLDHSDLHPKEQRHHDDDITCPQNMRNDCSNHPLMGMDRHQAPGIGC